MQAHRLLLMRLNPQIACRARGAEQDESCLSILRVKAE
jgi:peptide deformylase